jgi:hypothetical protein
MICDDCKEKPRDTAVGKCESCTQPVQSKSYKLCNGCSRMRAQCRCCRKSIRAAQLQPLGFRSTQADWIL